MMRKRQLAITWLSIVLVPFLLNYGLLIQPTGVDALVPHLEARVPELLKKYKVPGAAISLIEEGQVVWTQSFGQANAETGEALKADSVFQVASVSKQVAALGVMRLVEMGKIGLDDPVEKYLTRWHLPPSAFDANGVIIRRLLSHTAGLSLSGYWGNEPADALPTLEESLSGRNSSGTAVAITAEPGSAHRYSGGGYTLLQLLVEEVSGMPFAAFMEQEVLGPLGMTASSFDWRQIPESSLAQGHDERSRVLPSYRYPEQAAAGLHTTIGDLGSFVIGELKSYDGSGILKRKSLDQVYKPVAQFSSLGETVYAGLGHFISRVSGTDVVSHDGSNRGWKANITMIPAKQAGITIMTNGENGGALLSSVLDSWYHAQLQTHRHMNKVKYGVAVLVHVTALAVLYWSAAALRRLRGRSGTTASGRHKVLGFVVTLVLALALYFSITTVAPLLGYIDPALGWALTIPLLVRTLLAVVELVQPLLHSAADKSR